jgi:hypothetical protein
MELIKFIMWLITGGSDWLVCQSDSYDRKWVVPQTNSCQGFQL